MIQSPLSVISVGIDISKDRLDVAFRASDHHTTPASFPNTPEGIGNLITVLKKQGTAPTAPCVIESTGEYHLLPGLMITQAGFLVNCINPLITKRYQRSSIRNAKTDTVDALRLAEIGIREENLPVFSADSKVLGAKKVISFLATVEKTKQRLTASAKRLRETEKILGMKLDLSAIDSALSSLDREILVLREYVRTTAPDQETVKDLGTIKGISEEQIAILLAALSDKSFSNRDQLVAFVGLDVMPRRSGQWRGKEKLSKRGNPYIRKVLYQMAWGLKQHNPEYQQYYARLYHEQKKHYTTCLMAVARKFLRFFYAYYWKELTYPQPIS